MRKLMRRLVCPKCHTVVEETIYGGRRHWGCRRCRKIVRPIAVNPLLEILGTAAATGVGFGAGMTLMNKISENWRKKRRNPVTKSGRLVVFPELLTTMRTWVNPKRERGDAVLPSGSSINPKSPYTNWLIQGWAKNIHEIVFYLVKFHSYSSTKGYRLISSFGSLGFRIGEDRQYQHDQTGTNLGRGTIVSILKINTLSTIPQYTRSAKPIALWVYK